MLTTATCPVLDIRPRFKTLKSARTRSGHRPVPKRREVIQERIRPDAKKKHRVHKPKQRKVRFLTGSELEFAGLLIRRCVEYKTQLQVDAFEIDLTGRGKTRFRPDFYLPVFDTYVEITEGKSERLLIKKRSKINAARRAGKTVYLVTSKELRDLRDGFTDLFDLIDPGTEYPKPRPTVHDHAADRYSYPGSLATGAHYGRYSGYGLKRRVKTAAPGEGRPEKAQIIRALNEAGIAWRHGRRAFELSSSSTFRPDLYLPGLGLMMTVTASAVPAVLERKARCIELLAAEHNEDCLLIGPTELEALASGRFTLSEFIANAA